jgi:hypothetical protein
LRDRAEVTRQHDSVALKHWAAPLYWQPSASVEEHVVVPAASATGLPANANPLVFVAMQPCRVVDTRTGSQGFSGAFGPPSLSGGVSRTIPILSSTTCTIPALAQAYSFEITVVPPGPLGYVTAFPTGVSSPVAAIAVESPQGYLVSNTGIIPGGTNGSVDLYASNPTDIIIDINGYYVSIGDAAGNTALGLGALGGNSSGINNTATGTNALQSNTSGGFNTAIGNGALSSNTTGSENTASGQDALSSNTTGSLNTANGQEALMSNTTGLANTAMGYYALKSNTTGGFNTASGNAALAGNTTGTANTAIGTNALNFSTTGSNNTASGSDAMLYNATGGNNTASGNEALQNNTTGNNNIAIGYQAAFNVSTGNSNIHIGSQGNAKDSGTIRIGGAITNNAGASYPAQTSFFVAGLRGVTTGNNDAIPVVIDSNGQLGTVNSSARFKEDIHEMGTASSGLMRLRPVMFRYQKPFADGSKPIQYGLIAEEVADVYPDLIARSADGQIESVKYQVLDSMLLNELQKEHRHVQQQAETIRLLEIRLAALEQTFRSPK